MLNQTLAEGKSRQRAARRKLALIALLFALSTSIAILLQRTKNSIHSGESAIAEHHAPDGKISAPTSVAQPDSDEQTRNRVAAAYGKLPMSFEANRGQVDGRVKFFARGSGYALFLTSNEAVLSLRKPDKRASTEAGAKDAKSYRERQSEVDAAVLRVGLIGANPQPVIKGADQLPGRSHYFTGDDAQDWVTDIDAFAAVRYESVYPGIDLVYYGNQQQLEYDFRLDAGADPSRIALSFKGARSLTLGADGALVLNTDAGEVRQQRPFIYQEVDGARHEVAGQYRLLGENRVGFEVGNYDASLPLVIDPILLYSSYLGGGGSDSAWGIATDSSGSTYIVGDTPSTDYPGPSPIQAAKDFGFDAFILKLNPSGSAIVYATYLGGNYDRQRKRSEREAKRQNCVPGF